MPPAAPVCCWPSRRLISWTKEGAACRQLSDRVGTFTDSVIRRMTCINNQYDSINLSQGFPDFDPPKQLLNEAIRRLEKLSALLA
mgnify:FL=1